MLKRAAAAPTERPKPAPSSAAARNKALTAQAERSGRTVTAHYPHHVWNVDFTTIATAAGYWAPWFPFALMLLWPFSWHIAVIVDHFSRKIVGFGVFRKEATAEELCALLTRTVERSGRAPKYIVSDQGAQFQSEYRAWCDSNRVKPRFGAIGKHGSIALTERCIRSLKDECLRIIVVPYRLEAMITELELYVGWFNEHRPHQGLAGKTPNEVFEGKVAARDGPRWETRVRGPCSGSGRRGAAPVMLRDEPGTAVNSSSTGSRDAHIFPSSSSHARPEIDQIRFRLSKSESDPIGIAVQGFVRGRISGAGECWQCRFEGFREALLPGESGK
jgi:transposase InsO family protein